MAKKRGTNTPGGGTKFPKISPRGSPLRRGKNIGGTGPAAGRRPVGSSRHGRNIGKQNSG